MGRSSWGCGFAELGADRFQFFELRHAVLRPLPADPGLFASPKWRELTRNKPCVQSNHPVVERI